MKKSAPPPEHEMLIAITRERFPELEGFSCQVEPILKGGSDRRFYRLVWPGRDPESMVLMFYTHARPDNVKFLPATRRLAALGVRVPEIYASDERRLCMWLQDLGPDDLHNHRDEPWEVRRDFYRQVLVEALKLHAVGERSLKPADLAELEPGFDGDLYLWEQNYFLDHYLRDLCCAPGRDHLPEDAADCLKLLRRRLAGRPRCLIHRDFQSQNILIHDGRVWLVDYQGLRLGLGEYDLASLLYDPYVALSRSEREELLLFYAAGSGRPVRQVREIFQLCSAQRLMQALGAYGNLGRNQGKPQFLRHAPAARARLRELCEEVPLLAPLGLLLDRWEAPPS
jgi:aminoglycoside/choline kinase family phosphotransferase